jgi:hypothetical protein
MSQKHTISLVLAFLLMYSSLGQVALAEKVDPCQYGCPKSGCPQCPEGGPIKPRPKSGKAKAATGNQIHAGRKAKRAEQPKKWILVSMVAPKADVLNAQRVAPLNHPLSRG